MSGPSATEKPMSAKIATISSITWLIGWMRPVSIAGQADRQRHVERLALELRLERGVLQHRAPRGERLRDLDP